MKLIDLFNVSMVGRETSTRLYRVFPKKEKGIPFPDGNIVGTVLQPKIEI